MKLAAVTAAVAILIPASAHALPCPTPSSIWDRNLPEARKIEIITDGMRRKIDMTESIFQGRAASVEPFGRVVDQNLASYLITYRVSHWRKGRGGPTATIHRTIWCKEGCDRERIAKELTQDPQEEVVMATKPALALTNTEIAQLPARVDGTVSICTRTSIMAPFDKDKAPYRSLREADMMEFAILFSELEKLPVIKP